MRDFFEKHEALITFGLIIIYIISNSICMQNYGVADYRTVLVNFVLTLVICIFIKKSNLTEYFGLNKFPKAKEYLYFIPLIMIVSINLWNGVNLNNTIGYIICHICAMIFVGFIEEIIFRGFLFKMMEKDGVKSAIIVSSITFGIGHIINLFNGAEIIPTIIQIIQACSIGYLFVIIFYKSKSMWPCIVTHAAINSLSVFNVESESLSYIITIFVVLVSLGYALYINKKIKE